ncbi:hypothetical protein FNF31_02332 [Cafeteria roenbergensis]|uniref:Uncharacterized protein n=1 Tax=Cafeteria roenbergensis TaxID=33653 RepID=A0A5A8DGH5_CAFRO|nr:hypothetical protein FNF31_02332 [Cafeteria roenbergensis]
MSEQPPRSPQRSEELAALLIKRKRLTSLSSLASGADSSEAALSRPGPSSGPASQGTSQADARLSQGRPDEASREEPVRGSPEGACPLRQGQTPFEGQA